MEIGLITPPVGLNLYVINGIAPDVDLTKVLLGAIPYAVIMVFTIILLSIFPEIVTFLPNYLMGEI
jgi:TRAP-type C4-dicarboxylate transport system permease large subunit